MPKNIANMTFLIFFSIMAPFPIPLVQAPLNKMVMLNVNFITFKTLLGHSLLPLPLLHNFGKKLLSLLSASLIGVQHLSCNTKHHINCCMRFWLCMFCSPSTLEHKKFQPCSQLCCFLSYDIEQKGYRCYNPVAKWIRISRHVVF